jgi:hypothetical protein
MAAATTWLAAPVYCLAASQPHAALCQSEHTTHADPFLSQVAGGEDLRAGLAEVTGRRTVPQVGVSPRACVGWRIAELSSAQLAHKSS